MLSEELLVAFTQSVQSTLLKELTKPAESLTHNHPPMRIIVSDCEYCQKYGNCLLMNKTS